MDRARRAAASSRRKPLPDSASPQSTPEASADRPRSPASPVAALVHTPHTAPQSRRGSRAAPQHAFTFSTPGPNRAKKRSRTMDGFGFVDEDDGGSPRKGGHSLRKRARVDYTFEHIDDGVLVPNSSSSARARKRRSDLTDVSDDVHGPNPLRRRDDSLSPDAPASLRRNPARKSAEAKVYRDDDDVKDTIEVGVSFDHDDPDPLRASHSSDSSPLKSPLDAATESEGHSSGATAVDAITQQHVASAHLDAAAPAKSPVDEPATIVSDPSPHLPQTAQPFHPDERDSALESTQETLQDAPDELSAQDAEVQQPRPWTRAGGQDAPAALEVAVKQHSPEAEMQSSPQLLPHNKHTETFQQSPAHEHHDAMPPTALEKTEQHKTETAEPVSHNVPSAQEIKGHGERGRGSPQNTVKDSIETAIDGIPEQMPPSSDPPTILISGASESSTAIPVQAELGPDAASIKSAPQPSLARGSLGARHPAGGQPQGQGGRQGAVDLWVQLSPYVDGEYEIYPEKRGNIDEDESGEGQTPEENHNNEMEPMVEDNDDAADAPAAEAPTPVVGTPARASSVLDSTVPTAVNSPAPADDDGDEAYIAESQEAPHRPRYFKYRKIRGPEAYLTALQNYHEMSSVDLYELLDVINVAMQDWEGEWAKQTKLVNDCENAAKRRSADTKYETKVQQDWHLPGVNHVESELTLKGHKAKEKEREASAETRYLQGQDKIMAASYGFEYDSHPSKVGRQNPDSQQSNGVMTRGRSLRNQPRQTAKATEADEVTGKRPRKPVQLFDPAARAPSRSATPALPGKSGRKRKSGNAAEPQKCNALSRNKAESSPGREETPQPKSRPRRVSNRGHAGEDVTSSPGPVDQDESAVRPGRRRVKNQAPAKQQAAKAECSPEGGAGGEPKQQQRKRHLLTLKIPKGRNLSEPSSAITDNGDSRPSTASSDSTSHTAESSYSFRPKRQKRFRDEPDDGEVAEQLPATKRAKRAAAPQGATKDAAAGDVGKAAPEAPQAPAHRKYPKIKVISKNRTVAQPGGGEGEERPKDYKSMTKSEKMSASMKSRWANGNMAGAVEKRKATLAAKKAAQAAADQKVGTTAPKPKAKGMKKETAAHGQQQQQQQQQLDLKQHGMLEAVYSLMAN